MKAAQTFHILLLSTQAFITIFWLHSNEIRVTMVQRSGVHKDLGLSSNLKIALRYISNENGYFVILKVPI